MMVAVKNGVIDLNTGNFSAPDRELLMTKMMPVEYDPKATCPTFEKFLLSIMGNDAELVSFIQRAVGYSLTGSTAEQCLFFLYGSGANGKSTLLNVLMELMDGYAIQCPAETLMVKQNSGIPADIARLRGSRFVATSETEDGKRFAEATVKQLTGGDVIPARFLYGNYFEFVPTFKIWLAANHMPIIGGDDYGIWRRFKMIPFEVTIPDGQRDGKLPEKLRSELPGILNWAIKGCLEWQQIGLNTPEKITAATEAYRGEMDIVGNWISENCGQSARVEARSTTLYKDYSKWCEDNGQGQLSHNRFSRKLGSKGYKKIKKANGQYYLGIGLLDDSEVQAAIRSDEAAESRRETIYTAQAKRLAQLGVVGIA